MRQSLSLLLASLLTGCGSGDDDDAAGATVSCQVESAGDAVQCLEYTVPPDAVSATRDGCVAGGGMLVARCPQENRIGTCTMHPGGGVSLVTRYYSGGLTLDTAEQICSGGGGTFTPG